MCTVPVGKKCEIIGCNNTAIAKGLCDKHRKRKERHGVTDDSVGKLMLDGYLKLASHPLYDTWRNITRSENGKNVCSRWKKFAHFVEDIGSKPEGTFAMKRIDVSEDWGVSNVRWEPFERGTARAIGKAAYMRSYAARLRDANPEYFREADLKKNYGITLQQYEVMERAQDGKCAICGRPETRRGKDGALKHLCVDHCHTEHKVRDLLCSACNTAIGAMKENIETLKSAISYLERHKQSAENSADQKLAQISKI